MSSSDGDSGAHSNAVCVCVRVICPRAVHKKSNGGEKSDQDEGGDNIGEQKKKRQIAQTRTIPRLPERGITMRAI